MRVPLIAGNWKMNTTVPDALKLVKDMKPGLEKIEGIEKVICPPFISIVPVQEFLEKSGIKLGAQNLYFEEKGAYTGEISPLMLSGICEYVIIGHSERRQYFNETDELISRKVNAAMKHRVKPILCVGENLEEYEAGKTQDVVRRQVNNSLKDIVLTEELVIAYEPVWAIGTGKAASGNEADKTISFIRKLISEKYGPETASKIRILYGGSITASNIDEFISRPDIDGGLVGGASLKATEFTEIVRKTAQIRR